MDEKEMIREAEKRIQKLAQKASYQIGDLVNRWPSNTRPICLAVMQSVLNGLVPLMDEADRKLFNQLVAHTEVTMLPAAFDPRRSGK